MLTPSLEDYLEEVYHLCCTLGQARSTDLAARIRVSLPAVTKAMQKLSQAGFIEYKAYEEISLTQKGSDLGNYLIKRNHILHEFLEILQVMCDVSEEVESMEHYISPNVVMAIGNLVQFLQHDSIRASYAQFRIDTEQTNGLSAPPASTNDIGLDVIKHMRRFGGKACPPTTEAPGKAETRLEPK